MKLDTLRLIAACLLLLLAACERPLPAKRAPQAPEAAEVVVEPVVAEPPQPVDPSDEFFAKATIHELHIEIAPADMERLRANNRSYVRATLREGDDVVYKSVGVKLKGAAGSFRDVDDRPALTLNMDKFTKKQDFHSLGKFHLNNSVQDPSYLNELLCSEICRDAGLPAARATHARVWFNDRDLGLYVLKEGFDRRFLKRHFEKSNGNLYDGGFLQDVDVDLEKDSGDGPDDRSDLHALRDACNEVDPAKRWERMAELLDVDAFLTFVAIEFMTCHWDGYAANKNNYRLYFDPATGKAHFFPHGMDQMFGDAGFPLLNHPPTIVAAAVMQNPEWRAKYRERLKELLPLFAPATKLMARVDEVALHLKPFFEQQGPEQTQAFADQVRELKERLLARAENLKEQIEHPEPLPQSFDEMNPIVLTEWYGAAESGEPMHEEVEIAEGKNAYSISVGPNGPSVASWRRRLLLAKGHYRLEARAKTEAVERIEEGDRGVGAGIRISGSPRENKVVGNSDWTDLKFEFEVLEDVRDVEFVAELRAAKGRVWFDGQSLRLHRIDDAPATQ